MYDLKFCLSRKFNLDICPTRAVNNVIEDKKIIELNVNRSTLKNSFGKVRRRTPIQILINNN